jgi:signal transduction histidine kinase
VSRARPWRAGIAGLLFLGVAAIDYWTGYELWFSLFYLVFIGGATWFYGRTAGIVVSVASAGFSLTGDIASGAHYGSALVPWWNLLISLSFYLVMVMVIWRLRTAQEDLERLVRERTAKLRSEMAERAALEHALLEASEREQRGIGHELHDSLCQHLTGTAMAAQVLSGGLAASGRMEAQMADRLVSMIEEGITLSRSLARGLAPLELDAAGLVEALRELALTTSARGAPRCEVVTGGDLRVSHSEEATQLFRIAQEAVRNAVKHAAAAGVTITLREEDGQLVLGVEDDGKGISRAEANKSGMGFRIMRYRAAMIGAEIAIDSDGAGTRIKVRAPGNTEARASVSQDSHG